jgi:hypothetical protein
MIHRRRKVMNWDDAERVAGEALGRRGCCPIHPNQWVGLIKPNEQALKTQPENLLAGIGNGDTNRLDGRHKEKEPADSVARWRKNVRYEPNQSDRALSANRG